MRTPKAPSHAVSASMLQCVLLNWADIQSSWSALVSCYSIMIVGGFVCVGDWGHRGPCTCLLLSQSASPSLSVSVSHFTNICSSGCFIFATEQPVQQRSLAHSLSPVLFFLCFHLFIPSFFLMEEQTQDLLMYLWCLCLLVLMPGLRCFCFD